MAQANNHSQFNSNNSSSDSNCGQCKGLLRICVPTILCFRAKLRRKNVRLCNTPQFKNISRVIRNPAFAYAKTTHSYWQHVFLNPKLIASTHILLLIRLTCPCNVGPLTTQVYIVKLGFTGVYIIFLFMLK